MDHDSDSAPNLLTRPGWLKTNDATAGGGLADRCAGVAAQSRHGQPIRDSGARAAAGAAGMTLMIPRIAYSTVMQVGASGAIGQFVQIGLAQNDGPGRV